MLREKYKSIMASIIAGSFNNCQLMVKLFITRSQLKYFKTVLKDEERFERMVVEEIFWRLKKVTRQHVDAVKQFFNGFSKQKFTSAAITDS